MAASLIGGLLAQWPLGLLSDKVNRRYVIILAAALITVSSAMLSLMALWSEPVQIFGINWLIITGAAFGAGFHPIYSLCMAHANDFVSDENFVGASAGLQFIQGIGAIIGPMLAGICMYLGGSKMLFVYIGALAGGFIFYTIKRMSEGRKPGWISPFNMLTRNGILTLFKTN